MPCGFAVFTEQYFAEQYLDALSKGSAVHVITTWEKLVQILKVAKENLKATHVAFDATTKKFAGFKRVTVEPIDDVIQFACADRVD